MKRLIVSIWFLLIALIGNYIFFALSNDVSVIPLNEIIPIKIGKWHGDDLKLKEYVFNILGSKNVLSRKYTYQGNNKKLIFLTIVASDNDRRVVHPPEVCLKGGGERVVYKKVITIDGLKINELLLDGNPNQKVWYWYALGNSFTSNYYLHQLKSIFYRLINRPRRAYLIRIVFWQGQEKDAHDFINEFLKSIEGGL